MATTVVPARTDSTTAGLTWAAIGALAAWVVVVLVWGDAPFALTFDDAWYYAEIGRHLADGQGSTFDGLNATNGYHPLWMLVTTAIGALPLEATAAMRVQLAVQLACWAAAVALVARRVERPPAFLVPVVVLVAANPFVLKSVASGLESGLVVLVGALLLTHAGALDLADPDGAGRRRFGALLALAFLARTDGALLTVMAAVWVLPQVRGVGSAARGRLAQLFVAPVVTIAVYVAANLAAFGRPLQISGDIKRVDLTPVLAVAVLAGAALGLVVLGRLRALTPSPQFPRLTGVLASTGWYAAFGIGLIGYYTLLSAQQWLWYFAPVVLYAVALLLHGTADLLDGAAAEGPRSLRAVQAILLLPLLAGFVVTLGQVTDPGRRAILEANRDGGEWISTQLPDDAVIASWDAGVLGAFTDQPVVNLDGVVNSGEFADAMAAGTAGDLLRRQGVTHVANHGQEVDGDDPVARALVDGIWGPPTGADMDLAHLDPFTYTGSTTRGGSGAMAFFVYTLPSETSSG